MTNALLFIWGKGAVMVTFIFTHGHLYLPLSGKEQGGHDHTLFHFVRQRDEVMVSFIFINLGNLGIDSGKGWSDLLEWEGSGHGYIYLPSFGKRVSDVMVTSIFLYLESRRVAMTMPSSFLVEGRGSGHGHIYLPLSSASARTWALSPCA